MEVTGTLTGTLTVTLLDAMGTAALTVARVEWEGRVRRGGRSGRRLGKNTRRLQGGESTNNNTTTNTTTFKWRRWREWTRTKLELWELPC